MSDFKLVIAHHPYEAQREDEISFEQDELIKVTDFSDPDWWVGKKKDGSIGFFPSNFVTVKNENQPENQVEQPTENEEQVIEKETSLTQEGSEVSEAEEPVKEKKDTVIGMARVMEDYAMQEAGELSLHRGGIVNVYEVIDNEWSRGELNGKVGKYPSKYVEDIDMPGRPDLGKPTNESQKSPVDEDAPKGGFKLAAFGVKQGGIGSLLAGGFPGLKKTGGAKPVQEKPEPTVAPVISPPVVPVTPTESPVVASEATTTESKKSLGKAIVLHPYDAESEDELSLLRGEYVEILDRNVDDGWWKGLNEKGQSGVFPCNFVRELEDELVAPPTPTRARRIVQSRPASVQSPVTARPISVQAPAQRPFSIAGTTDPKPASHLASPSISEEVKEEEEEKTPVVENVQLPAVASPSVASPPAVTSPPVPERAVSPPVVENVRSPAVAERIVSPPVPERVISPPVPERVVSPPVPERVISPPAPERIVSPPVSERIVSPPAPERIVSPPVPERVTSPPVPERVTSPPVSERKASLVSEETFESPNVNEESVLDQEEKRSSAKEDDTSSIVSREIKPGEELSVTAEPIVSEELSVAAEPTISEEPVVAEEPAVAKEPVVDQEIPNGVEEKEEESTKESVTLEPEQEEKKEFDSIPSGPKLTAPSRIRIGGGRARRTPQATSQEPSQTEILEKELAEEKEEEKASSPAPSPPAKPVKPIFAKFPTPFAVGGDALSKTHLKPTQTRRLWEEKAAEPTTATEEEEPAPVRPSGVKNIASRFNFAGGNTSSGNEVLETKLKNHTKNEVEKVKKEFEQLLNEEREKRTALEKMVYDLIEKVKALEQQ